MYRHLLLHAQVVNGHDLDVVYPVRDAHVERARRVLVVQEVYFRDVARLHGLLKVLAWKVVVTWINIQ